MGDDISLETTSASHNRQIPKTGFTLYLPCWILHSHQESGYEYRPTQAVKQIEESFTLLKATPILHCETR